MKKIYPLSKTEVIKQAINPNYDKFAPKEKLISLRLDLETQFKVEVLKYKLMIEQGYMSLSSAIRTAENRTGYRFQGVNK